MTPRDVTIWGVGFVSALGGVEVASSSVASSMREP